jgi:hypothetical protein
VEGGGPEIGPHAATPVHRLIEEGFQLLPGAGRDRGLGFAESPQLVLRGHQGLLQLLLKLLAQTPMLPLVRQRGLDAERLELSGVLPQEAFRLALAGDVVPRALSAIAPRSGRSPAMRRRSYSPPVADGSAGRLGHDLGREAARGVMTETGQYGIGRVRASETPSISSSTAAAISGGTEALGKTASSLPSSPTTSTSRTSQVWKICRCLAVRTSPARRRSTPFRL